MANPMKAELEIKLLLKPINEYRTAAQKPCCVQVEEWVGLVDTLGYRMRRRRRNGSNLSLLS